MAHTFTPPTVNVVPPFLPDTKGQAFRLFRHYHVNARGVNIYVRSDGTVSTDYPVAISIGSLTSLVSIPLPMDPVWMGIDPTNTQFGGETLPLKNHDAGSNPTAGPPPYVWVYDVLDPNGSVQKFQTNPWLVSWFRGACGPYTISNGMYTLLVAQGYGAYCT